MECTCPKCGCSLELKVAPEEESEEMEESSEPEAKVGSSKDQIGSIAEMYFKKGS